MPANAKQKKVFTKILKCLGFEKDRKGKHGDIWKHPEKNITQQIAHTSGNLNWVHDLKRDIQRMVKEHFSMKELETLLKPLVKKRQLRFMSDGNVRLLRKTIDLEDLEDFEGELLGELLQDKIVSHTSDEDMIKEIKKNIPKSLKKKLKI
jgi:hypothetical protein